MHIFVNIYLQLYVYQILCLSCNKDISSLISSIINITAHAANKNQKDRTKKSIIQMRNMFSKCEKLQHTDIRCCFGGIFSPKWFRYLLQQFSYFLNTTCTSSTFILYKLQKQKEENKQRGTTSNLRVLCLTFFSLNWSSASLVSLCSLSGSLSLNDIDKCVSCITSCVPIIQ